ncbi:MAG: endolytic transglycosylase MltG [Candidatus Nanopelagicales bacterium]
MSNLGLQTPPDSRPPEGMRHRGRSWVAVLLSLGVLLAIGLGVKFAIDRLPAFGADAADYASEGTGSVAIVVEPGQTLAEIGRTLKAQDVVASVDAWLEAAKVEPEAQKISPGTYDMAEQMSAQAAVARMVDPDSRIVDRLLLREGLRLDQSIATISQATGITKKKLTRAAEGGEIGLPDYAEDNAEGFVFPATYELSEGENATEVLSRTVKRWSEAAQGLDLEARAKANGVSPYELMTIASLVQAEGHPDDFDKVARVIYNRLDPDIWGGTNGLLQIDATINYALGKSEINLTKKEIEQLDSPFNTYRYVGLPPTPINSPGEAAIQAALNPADGPWLWYVTVNPDTGETKFTDDFGQFESWRVELSKWLDENPQ